MGNFVGIFDMIQNLKPYFGFASDGHFIIIIYILRSYLPHGASKNTKIQREFICFIN